MVRPEIQRRIGNMAKVRYFKPQGIPLRSLDEVILTEDQLEAIRLADLEELYQEEAAERMNVSRPTFSRIIASAHKIISDAIINGKAIRIQGGNVKLNTSHGRGKRMRRGRCCGQT